VFNVKTNEVEAAAVEVVGIFPMAASIATWFNSRLRFMMSSTSFLFNLNKVRYLCHHLFINQEKITLVFRLLLFGSGPQYPVCSILLVL
jgi:hypothetical protein